MAKCRSCNAEITWAASYKTGRKMPVDKEPVPGGNVHFTGEYSDDGLPWIKVQKEAPPDAARQLGFEDSEGVAFGYVSHFSSCKFAEAHRARA